MEQGSLPTTPEGWRQLAIQCRLAIGSLYCELQPREKRVIEQIIRFSYDWCRDWVMFGSSDMLAELADRMNKGDLSNALGNLSRHGIIKKEKAGPLYGLRQPMRYRLVPDALVALARPPQLTQEANHRRNLIAAWHVAANEAYPLQCDLIPPDPDLFGDAMSELSRASVLASTTQNKSPKPGSSGEVVHFEGLVRPGPAATIPHPELILPPGKTLREALGESLAQSEEPKLVGNPPTSEGGSGWRISNQAGSRALDPDIFPDGNLKIPSGKHPDSAPVSVGEFPTSPGELRPKVIFVPVVAENDDTWVPPTNAEELFAELLRCMGRKTMANYGDIWFSHCAQKPRCVAETIEEFKNARLSPKHKGWYGGLWLQAFQRAEVRQAKRQAARRQEVAR